MKISRQGIETATKILPFWLVGIIIAASVGATYAVITYSGTIQSPYQVNGAPTVTAVISENQTANVGFGTTNNGDCTVTLTGTTYSISCPSANIDPGAYYILTITVSGGDSTAGSQATLTPQTADTHCHTPIVLSAGSGSGTCKVTAGSGSGTAQVTLSLTGP